VFNSSINFKTDTYGFVIYGQSSESAKKTTTGSAGCGNTELVFFLWRRNKVQSGVNFFSRIRGRTGLLRCAVTESEVVQTMDLAEFHQQKSCRLRSRRVPSTVPSAFHARTLRRKQASAAEAWFRWLKFLTFFPLSPSHYIKYAKRHMFEVLNIGKNN
jgi:hypothetical protein